jgi:uncharacterized protein (DUF2252 family)
MEASGEMSATPEAIESLAPEVSANGASPPPARLRTKAESIELGKQARKATPRSSHAVYQPPLTRADPMEILERESATRVPELVPIRYGRMLVSPFTFYRGAAAIMAGDLSETPRSGLDVQCCGDAHLSNFGVFASPERRMVFDLNDFDETHVGPWEWDVKRLAVSMLIAAQSNGFTKAEQRRAVLDTVESYRTAMANFASTGTLSVWYARLEADEVLKNYAQEIKRGAIKRTEESLAHARTKDSMQAFSKLTEVVDGRISIVDQSPLIVPIHKLQGGDREEIFAELRGLFATYMDSLPVERRSLLDRFELVDVARKVVGVGSVGTRAWIALLMGADGTEPLFLQMKEAEASVLEPFTGPSEFPNHGQRVVVGQRLMQASSDIFLGWVRVNPPDPDVDQRDFYVRQLRDWKGSAEVETLRPEGLAAYGRACGWTLARAHARTGDRVAIASYLGNSDSFDRALLTFSAAYAEQNDRDFAALVDAADSGRIQVERGL